MIGAESIFRLAEEMIERRADDERGPFLLFLGKGCAHAAKVPDTVDIARQVLRDSSLPTEKYVKGLDRRFRKQVLQAFYDYVADLSGRERYDLLQRFYAKTAVPLFYQDLVRLIEAGYFLHILTTNIDTLLEQALNGAGLWPKKDYELISLGARKLPPPDLVPDTDRPRPTIVKLHGDIAQRQAAITPDEITEALQRHSRFLQRKLSGDMVMVSYEFESEPVTRWLASAYGKLWSEPPTLWWVDEKRPPVERVGGLEEGRRIEYVEGEVAKPEGFFGRLLYELQQHEYRAVSKGRARDLMGDDEASVDAEYLRGQIQRSQRVLYALEQQAVPGDKDEQLKSQIEYQRGMITKLEDQLRGLGENRDRLLKLMNQVRDSAQRANVDPTTMDFLNTQIKMVTDEYHRSRPNQDVVSASASAIVVLAERLGPKAIDQDIVRELASFAPSSSVRRVS